MLFERSKACNYSAHVFLPILFGVCAGIIFFVFLQQLLLRDKTDRERAQRSNAAGDRDCVKP